MKRKIIWIVAAAAMCAAVLLALSGGGWFGTRPFASLSADEISRVTLIRRPPDDTLVIQDREAFIKLTEILNRVTVYGEDDSGRQSVGQWVEFVLAMKDGRTVSIAAYNPFLVVDSVWYRSEYEPCESLNSLGNRLAKGG